MIHRLSSPRHAPVVALCLLALLAASATACKKRTSYAEKDHLPAAVRGTDSAAPSASASPGNTIPTLRAHRFAPGGQALDGVYAVEGGIAVSAGNRVGLVSGETVTWVGNVPKESSALGPNRIVSVRGRAPDMLAAIYVSENGRAPQPTYQLLSGKQESLVVAGGGGWGHINGAARVGDTIFIAADQVFPGPQIIPVHGPKLVRHLLTPAEAACKPGEVTRVGIDAPTPAIVPEALESTPAGTMVSLGKLCEKGPLAAEVWDKDGKTWVQDLSKWWRGKHYGGTLLKGEGDQLWAVKGEWDSIVVHYDYGTFHPLPDLERRIESAFVSTKGQLYASDGKTIYRYEGGKWAPAFLLPTNVPAGNLVMDAQGGLWMSGSEVYRLQPGPAQPALAMNDCGTPFVYLYTASRNNGKDYLYPTTRAALASFPDASSLGLVEFGPEYARAVGVTVASHAQGKALIAHLATTMKDERPRYFCYEPKEDVRQIPLGDKP